MTGVASMRWVRPDLTTSAHASAFASSATARWSSAGMRSSMSAPVTAMCTEVGNTSFEDCDAFTWSFGCTGEPRLRDGERREHLVHVHVRGRAASRSGRRRSGTRRRARPAMTSSAARGDRVGDRRRRARRARSLASAAAFLMRASAAICAGSRGSPEIGKFSTARCVCAL